MLAARGATAGAAKHLLLLLLHLLHLALAGHEAMAATADHCSPLLLGVGAAKEQTHSAPATANEGMNEWRERMGRQIAAAAAAAASLPYK